jgi:protein-S-isoprenylcysteine O-methyltransferase Ste14
MGRWTVVSGQDLDERRRIQRARRRFLLVVMVTAGAVAAVAVAAFAWLGGYESDVWDGEPPWWAAVLGVTLAVVGLIVQIGALVWVVRSGRYRANRDSRLWGLSLSHRRKLVRQVRRGGDAPEDLPLLRHTAEQMAGQRWFIALIGGLALMNSGSALMLWSWAWLAFSTAIVSMVAIALALTLRDARRGEAFLRAHPAPGRDPQDRTVSGM